MQNIIAAQLLPEDIKYEISYSYIYIIYEYIHMYIRLILSCRFDHVVQ